MPTVVDALFEAVAEVRRWQRGTGSGRSFGHWFGEYVVRPRLGRLIGAREREDPPPWIRPEYRAFWRAAGKDRALLSGLSFGDAYYWNRVRRGALLVGGSPPVRPMRGNFRNPWLYLPLVEFMAAVPWSEKLDPGIDRTLQRRSLRGTLPEATRLRGDKRVPSQAFFIGLRSSQLWADFLTRTLTIFCTKPLKRPHTD
jgi:Asparagine synthase